MARGNLARGNLADLTQGRLDPVPCRMRRLARWTAILSLLFGASFSVAAQDAARLAAGEEAWDKAGCLQCHGSSGEGGAGGEFPAGPSLRKTRLDRAGLTETISCGLPGTQMPGWLDDAYTQRPCYGFPNGPAPDGTTLTPVLSANEVEALVDYLLAKIVGH
jgi:mono/diheme cytochrome c family protein